MARPSRNTLFMTPNRLARKLTTFDAVVIGLAPERFGASLAPPAGPDRPGRCLLLAFSLPLASVLAGVSVLALAALIFGLRHLLSGQSSNF